MDEKIKITEQPRLIFWCPYVLIALHDLGGSAKAKKAQRQVLDLAEEIFDIDDKVLKEKNPKNKAPSILNRINWARYYLTVEKYIDNSQYGVWTLTDKAKEKIPNILANISDAGDFIKEMEKVERRENKNYQNKKQPKEQQNIDEESKSADKQQVEENLKKIEEDLQGIEEDLNVIKGINWDQFERLCGKIFEKLGYEKVTVTKKAKDGGIDGIGYLAISDLVRFKVVFQSKLYTKDQSVPPDKIDSFIGAMNRIGAEKGVFITTADFTQESRNRAESNGHIFLVNGDDLVELLRKHKIGYFERFQDLIIDREFFEKL